MDLFWMYDYLQQAGTIAIEARPTSTVSSYRDAAPCVAPRQTTRRCCRLNHLDRHQWLETLPH
jgi:hypothetical protein